MGVTRGAMYKTFGINEFCKPKYYIFSRNLLISNVPRLIYASSHFRSLNFHTVEIINLSSRMLQQQQSTMKSANCTLQCFRRLARNTLHLKERGWGGNNSFSRMSDKVMSNLWRRHFAKTLYVIFDFILAAIWRLRISGNHCDDPMNLRVYTNLTVSMRQ